jgi:S-adenosylmethionine hydrolase
MQFLQDQVEHFSRFGSDWLKYDQRSTDGRFVSGSVQVPCHGIVWSLWPRAASDAASAVIACHGRRLIMEDASLSGRDRASMPTSAITLTTDFGEGSPYVAAMKGAILSIHPAANIVDLTHRIPPQDIRQGAWALADVAFGFPAGTIHVAVVDPGVGTERGLVYARIGGHDFVCPDNGLLTGVCRRHRAEAIVKISEPRHWAERVSATFHGRDIMAPVAARLSLGLSPLELGPRQASLVELDWLEAIVVPGKVTGAVETIDSFGNLITNITSAQVAACRELGEQVRIECDEHETFGIFRTYGDVPAMTFVAIIGSTDRLELAITGENAAEMLRIRVGSPVEVTW